MTSPATNGDVGCTPSSISPATWIPGFSDDRSVYSCAIAANSTTIVDKMKDNCCKGDVHVYAGCYHWCEPKGGVKTDIEDWAACISDNVYFDADFGQSCNAMGGLEAKSAASQGEEPMKDSQSSAAAGGFSLNWKAGVLLGLVGLVQVIC